jgi:hypothetical protein
MKETNKKGLELLISEYIEGIGLVGHTLDKAKLEIIAKNWEQSKKYIKNHFIYRPSSVNIFLKKLKQEFNLELSEKEIRDLYDKNISPDMRNLEAVARFSEYTGIDITSSQIKKIWRNFFQLQWKKHNLEDMIKYIGNPIISQQQLDTICNSFLRGLSGEEKKQTEKEQHKPLESITARDLSNFLDILDISPNWNKRLAKKAYNQQIPFLSNEFCKDRFDLLKNIGITPNPSNVRKFYRDLFSLQKDSIYRDYEKPKKVAEGFERAFEITKIGLQPKEQKAVRDFYIRFLDHRNFDDIKKLEKLTRVNLSNETINKVYINNLKKGDIEKINLLKNETSVQPEISEKDIQDAYKELFQKAEVNKALRVYLFFLYLLF